jgi:hypothetical protein
MHYSKGVGFLGEGNEDVEAEDGAHKFLPQLDRGI